MKCGCLKVVVLLLSGSFAAQELLMAEDHSLWYDAPASDDLRGWEERSLPVGNGWFGVNVFGGVHAERLQVTEPTFLTRRNLTDALDIRLGFEYPDGVEGYRRGLDLMTGVTWMEQADGRCKFRREAFASYPARVFACRITCSEKGKLNFSVSPEVPFQRPFGRGREAYDGRTGHVTANGNVVDVVQHLQWYNVRFFGRILVETDGRTEALDHTVVVKDATEATLYFSCATNYRLRPESFAATVGGPADETAEPKMRDEDEPSEAVKARVAAAAKRGYAALKAEHVADFGGLMNRVGLNLGGEASDRAIPTDRLLAEYARGRASAYLEETYFQYGRYLLVSSSRPGTLPASLQGVWTAHDKSPWGSGYWHNINVQMNYWPAFTCNLAECFEAYAAFNAAFRPVTRRLVEEYFARHGLGAAPAEGESPDIWCVGTAVYPYAVRGGPGIHSGPGTGGFTTKCFRDWWDFTRDEKALRTYIWPTLHGMADFLTRCVKEQDGEWLSAFSASPEQWVKRPDGTGGYYHTVGCAFDQQMIHENNVDTLELARHLGVRDAVTERIERQLGHYAPVLVGESGQVKEFREEKRYGDIGEYRHRHISQLVGLYPGSIITRKTPEWMAAAKVTLTERGDESTGWALAHRLNCWARLGDGDHCHKLVRNLLSKRTNANLWDMHPPFQIDGNFGATAGVAEMLLQSHAGCIDLLPALPKEWAKSGSFRGLCARGAFEVDCEWKDGRPVSVRVCAKKGGAPDVRFAGKAVPFEMKDPEHLEERTSAAGVSDTNLPEIYLIGDSIRMGYCQNVATALTGRASVKWPEGNCMNSQNVLINLGWWRKFASSPKVVQFNCGHWDATDWDRDGEPITTIDEYRRNVRLIIRRLRRYYPDAKIVFATTTPMNPKLSDAKILARRTTDVIRRYNEAAVDVARDENVPVNDLFALTKDWPAEDFADYCHFTPAANVRLGAAIGEFLFPFAIAHKKEVARFEYISGKGRE